MRTRWSSVAALVSFTALTASMAHAQPAAVATTPVRGTCRGDGALHAPQTPAETAVDTALEQDLRDRHLTVTTTGRACTHAERASGTTTWSLVEWTADAPHHASQSQLAIVACVGGACSVASTNVFTRWGSGSVALSRTIDGLDTFEADASYVVLRVSRRQGGSSGENSSLLAVYYLDAGQVRGFDVTYAERLYDHYELAIDVRPDATVGASVVRGQGTSVERRTARFAARPTVRTLSALGPPIAHLDAL